MSVLLPWLRRGLARTIDGPDDRGAVPLPARAAIQATLTVVDSRGVEGNASVSLPLIGPGDVIGLGDAQVARTVPPDGSTDVETNFLPFVELTAPDLPWALTPAREDVEEALRPWLVLVCVEERDEVGYQPAALPLPRLTIEGDVAAEELPDLGEAWAWAHVQSLVPTPEIAGAVDAATGAVTARVLCPRRLRPGRTYRAALVPAFDAGVRAGLGEAPPDDGDDDAAEPDLGPAWDMDALPAIVELPVLTTWTFTTASVAVDFEELARRLEPDLEGGRLGYRPAHVDDGSLLAPSTDDTTFEYAGALVDPGSRPAGLSKAAGGWFRDGLTRQLQAAASRPVVPRRPPPDYDPATDDPVVGPPTHGLWASGTSPDAALDTVRWVAEANLVPDRRAAAGLGAEVVRAHQDELLAPAWDQAGDVAALRDELNRGRLAAEVGRSHQRRLAQLPDAEVLAVTGQVQAFVQAGGRTLAERVAASVVVPTGMVSPAYLRRTRPGGTLARRGGRRTGARPGVGQRAVERFVAASADVADRGDLEAVARFGAASVPVGAVTASTTWVAYDQVDLDVVPFGLTSNVVAPVQSTPRIASPPSDLVTAAAQVADAIDPMPWVVRDLDRRVRGIDLDHALALPTRVQIGARFPDPLFDWLHALGTHVLLPGIDEMADNRVRLLEVNEAWVAAFLVGANHEWAREALWHEYPADLGATAFSTFWPRIPVGTPDLAEDMHLWKADETLTEQVGDAASGTTVLLVRGDVVRLHPDVEMFLVVPLADGTPLDDSGVIPPDRTVWPSFSGRLDRRTVIVGFDVDPDDVLGEGWYAAIQEPEAGPRFGLDVADPSHHGRQPASWGDLSWGHVTADADALEAMAHLQLADTPWLDGHAPDDGPTWGRNSGHMAAITFQQPFRLLLPATYLVPERVGR